jgi:hypothetical protein
VQTATTRPKPKAEPRKTEEAEVKPEAKPKAKPETKPQQQVSAVTPPPANNTASTKGTQPAASGGTFDSRWGGFQ